MEERNQLTADLSEQITAYFHDKKYRLFREFCFKMQIKTLADITSEIVEDFSRQLGVGKTKAARIQTIYQNDFPIENESEEQSPMQPVETALPTELTFEQIQEINLSIAEAFSESHFKMIVNFCRANNVHLVSDLDGVTLRRIRTLNGMGPKKYRYLFERLESLHEELSSIRFEIEPIIFEQIQTQSVDKLIRTFGLNGQQTYETITVADLQGQIACNVFALNDSHNAILLNRYLTNPKQTIEFAIERLSDHERKVLELRHTLVASNEVMSENLGLTVERIYQVERRIHNKLQKDFEKKQLLQLLTFLGNSEHHICETYLATHLPEHTSLIKAVETLVSEHGVKN